MRNFKFGKKRYLTRIIKNSTIRKTTLGLWFKFYSYAYYDRGLFLQIFYSKLLYSFTSKPFLPSHQPKSQTSGDSLESLNHRRNTNEPVNRRLWYFIACNISFFRYIKVIVQILTLPLLSLGPFRYTTAFFLFRDREFAQR